MSKKDVREELPGHIKIVFFIKVSKIAKSKKGIFCFGQEANVIQIKRIRIYITSKFSIF